jgi:sugar phosphate isomerase/epimerase
VLIGASIGPHLDRIDSVPDTFDAVELALGEGERPIDRIDVGAVRDRLAAADLRPVVHLPYRQPIATAVPTIDDATLAYLDSVLGVAAALGAETAVAHPRGRGEGNDSSRLADRLSALSAAGDDHGITVCFETTGYAGGPALDRLASIATDAGVALCLDVGYAYLEAGVDGIEAVLDDAAGSVAHLHVHDVRRRGDTHVPVGSGELPLAELGPSLAALPAATATVEVFTDDPTYLTESQRRVRAATTR